MFHPMPEVTVQPLHFRLAKMATKAPWTNCGLLILNFWRYARLVLSHFGHIGSGFES
jgi:hypothetical protein